MEDGKAFFGAKSGGGQIVIDGTSAIISGGNGGDNENGMTITLANLNPPSDKPTTAIKVGSGVFSVDYKGNLNASSATVNGTIYAETGQIGCSSETSKDGWYIETHRLYSGSKSTRVEFNSNEANKRDENGNLTSDLIEPMAIWAGRDSSSDAMKQSFAVSKKGDLYAKSGNIGGWVLTANALMTSDNKIGLKNSGNFCFWAGANGFKDGEPTFANDNNTYFHVESSGKMTCKSAEIRGAIYADMGQIGNWNISGGSLSAGPTILSDKGTITTETFIIKKEDESTNMGSIGTIQGSKENNKPTFNLGLSTVGLGNERSIILLSDASIRLSTSTTSTGAIYLSGNTQINNTEDSKKKSFTVGGTATIKGATYIQGDISIAGNKLSCTVNKDNQTGIYARFA